MARDEYTLNDHFDALVPLGRYWKDTPPELTEEGYLPLKQAKDGSLDVNVQDQTTPPVDLYFVQQVGSSFTLTVEPTPGAIDNIGDLSIEVSAGHGILVGDYIGLFSGTGRFYFGIVLSVITNTIGLDTPIDFAFDISTTVGLRFTRDMNIDGSVTPQIFQIQAGLNIMVDVTRILISILSTNTPAMDDGKFGNITALTNGIVFRRVNDETNNIFNIKSNGELRNLAFDLEYSPAAPAGNTGLASRFSFAGQDKHGVAVRIAANEGLQLIIQDDLTGLTEFRAIAEGHIVLP